VKIYDVTELALRNLREALLRNSLTTVGISVGVASLVAMLSLGIGLQQLASRKLEKSGLFDTVVVTSRRDLRDYDHDQDKAGPAPAESPSLDETARLRIAQLPNVVEAYPDIRFVAQVSFDDKAHLVSIAGLPPSSQSNDAFEGMQGRFFSSDTAPEAILQKSFASELLGHKNVNDDAINLSDLAKPLVGKELTIHYAERVATPGEPDGPGAAYSVISKQQTAKIVGISDLDPDSLRGQAKARLFLPLNLAEGMHVMQASDLRDTTSLEGGVSTYSSIEVRVTGPNQAPSVEDAVKKMGFNTYSLVDATRSMRQFFAILDLFLGIFGSLALVVASIGIINTLVMAILERRREIGIMKAIGASDDDVRSLFFAEAGAMGVFGGLFGVLLGWLIGRAINFGTNVYLHRQHFPPAEIWFVPWWLVGGAITFAIVVSLLSGLYPAARASRLDPVQALRYE
jgi:putative ABC transport system permease protein